MIWIDTEEKLNWLLEAMESDDFQLVSRKKTEKEFAEMAREIAEYKAMHRKNAVDKNVVLA